MILGICGKKKHGKDKFASMLAESMPSLRRVSFAKRLKEICIAVYGLNEAQVNDEIGKEMILSVPIALDDGIYGLREQTGRKDIELHGLVATTPRQVLQFIGTDYVREAVPSYWLDIVDRQFHDAPEGTDFAVTDVRFPNEAELIRARGGKIVRILRIASEVKGGDKAEHSSEQMAFEPDYTIATLENDFALSKIICDFASRGMLEEGLEAFNWDLLCFSAPVFQVYYAEMWPEMCKVASEMLGSKVAA